MTADIQPLIEARPHLKDPLEFYAKWQNFRAGINGLLPKKGSAPAAVGKAYPPASAATVLRTFASALDLPQDFLVPLGQALKTGAIDFMELPLAKDPAITLPYGKEGQASLLFLLSRPFFLALREIFLLDGREWEGGRCPLCSARPALTSIAEGPRRLLHCSWCATTGPYRFIGCPNCGSEDVKRLGSLVPEGEAGYRVATCDACRTYVKVVEGGVLTAMSPDLADLASLPLDIVAQERGYQRLAPNPIGLTLIT